MRRPDMLVCKLCPRYGEKFKGVVHMGNRVVPVHSTRMGCTWFGTAEGRAADQDTRMAVMVAGANGGRSCPTTTGREAQRMIVDLHGRVPPMVLS